MWCSPPRRATAKVPLPPKVRLGCDALRKAKQSGLSAKIAQSVGARMGPRSLSQDLQIVGLNVNTSCKKQVGESLGTQRTVRVALPCYLLGRDRSPSGPVLWRACSTVFHACGPGAFREITQLEGSWVRWVFRPPRCCPRTSEVGTDLRAVRCCRQWHYKRTCPILRSSQNMPSPREDPNSLPDVLAARSTYRSTQLFP